MNQYFHHDDAPRGRLLTRGEMMAALGAGAFALGVPRWAYATAPSCVARPALTEGPFYLDTNLDRGDIRSDPGTGVVKQGAVLALSFHVSRIVSGGCEALPGAIVDIWQCDAVGDYSGVGNAEGEMFLRGFQASDESGIARFTTIYPGWYPGRAVHIHFKIRPGKDSRHEFTSQFFFDDALSDRVYLRPPYRARGEGKQRNEDDGIFRRSGRELLLAVEEGESGLSASFDIALDLEKS